MSVNLTKFKDYLDLKEDMDLIIKNLLQRVYDLNTSAYFDEIPPHYVIKEYQLIGSVIRIEYLWQEPWEDYSDEGITEYPVSWLDATDLEILQDIVDTSDRLREEHKQRDLKEIQYLKSLWEEG